MERGAHRPEPAAWKRRPFKLLSLVARRQTLEEGPHGGWSDEEQRSERPSGPALQGGLEWPGTPAHAARACDPPPNPCPHRAHLELSGAKMLFTAPGRRETSPGPPRMLREGKDSRPDTQEARECSRCDLGGLQGEDHTKLPLTPVGRSRPVLPGALLAPAELSSRKASGAKSMQPKNTCSQII
ncbi:hypothetical protein HJG60_008078 [Phyllostomus discolor]|uniref:Uncharacterized protein n=1 Tax=Phyllostomus discolor TaxID=89673 RepID=A0A834BEI3_9CHIR|nr:hypothetical protein HJG60_008078 [Phyllostomus discolor]